VACSGTKTFILRYRPKLGRSAPKRFMTLGRFGPVTVDEARAKAMKIIGAVADGHDPAAMLRENRNAITVEEAVREFLAEHVSIKRKAKTLASYRHVLSRHIIPNLGKKKIQDVTKADVIKLHASKSSTPAAANYALAALGSLYTWAAQRGHIPEDFNPTRRIGKFRENRRERFLTTSELQRLGDALRQAETTGLPWDVDETKSTAKHAPKLHKRFTPASPFAAAAIRLLLFTGCRLREILDLKWEYVDLDRGALFLPDSKTGRKTVLLPPPAIRVLHALPRCGPFVIAGPNPQRPLAGLKRPWAAIRKRADLKAVRLHDLRHSYASVAAGAGFGLPIIGRLLGHTQPSTTARYAHLADDPLRRAGDVIAGRIAAAMGDPVPLDRDFDSDDHEKDSSPRALQ